ncbi:hypothetical protein CVU82_00460 [Candidatus Falkowbacteria bacterium HGW-Falkowbacteria-1]|jgi:dephospho-CoA kinase|uniref:Dephospho-CoA kinase n=1 Tax=Candidatus Falkowbacteria bacterium HGW-Falkowbacteria-1 TaxID=2013768 RepID=A0A2N2EAE7_9BACT|nr:MAG: hypothetical protein CVU82_00460 [Candidatus Falkowbacteria bacterium HGW-Falkowbacteria-1]
MEKKIIIGLVGQIACGKGVMKKYLIKKNYASDYRFSTILRDVLNRLGVEINRNSLQKVSTILRQNFGEDLLAKAIAKDAKNDNSHFIVIDGIRRMADVKYLKELPEFKLISIVADKEIRYKRVLDRNENAGDDKKTIEEFEQEEMAETEEEIPTVMKNADYEIINNSTWDKLHGQIDDIVEKIKNEK